MSILDDQINDEANESPRPQPLYHVKTMVITLAEESGDNDYSLADIEARLNGTSCSDECLGKAFTVINMMLLAS